METLQQKLQHLYWRAGFGPSLETTKSKSTKEAVDLLFANSKNHTPLVNEGWTPVLAKDFRNLDDEAKTAYREQEKQARLKLNQNILARFAYSKEVLREKMTFFWMDHFACRITNPVFLTNYYNTVNAHALGKFGDLLHEMIRNAALLQYLSNNLNRKLSPNENFARELMELFTLGIGNYSEQDIKEGARALTGWGFDRDGVFTIRNEHHDTGTKSFLGKQGNFDGDDIIKIILEKKQCAVFITTKIYSYFVNDKPDQALVTSLSDELYNSNYDIGALLLSIFSSEWFYKPDNIGTRIKSPVELMTGMTRDFKIKFENPMMAIQLQKIMGQMLFDPPNVAGWPSGIGWIDSSRLLYRMRLPELVLLEAESILSPKEEFDNLETVRADRNFSKNKKLITTSFDASVFQKHFAEVPKDTMPSEIMNYLLQCLPGKSDLQLIAGLTKGTTANDEILKTAIYVMSLPEYQLC